jgi:PAS domain S-box-containing protein
MSGGPVGDLDPKRLPARSSDEPSFRALAEHAPDIIAELDARGRYLYVNPSYQRLLGWSPEGLVGRHAAALVHPDDREPRSLEFGELLRGGPSAQYRRIRVADADGSWHWFETVACAYRTAEGELRVVSSGREITARLQDEERLQRASELATAQEVVGSVAHALRTPLTALLGTAGLLVEQRGAADPLPSRLLGLARRIDRVVTRSLQLFQDGEISAERVAPGSLLREVYDEHRERADGGGITLVVLIEPELPELWVDAELIQTALGSLVENALEAVSAGGEVVLSARAVLRSGVIQLDVADTGPGIPPNLQAEVGKPFFTTKSRGTGLGLPIARGIAHAHGGSLRIHPRPGGGTEATLELPSSSWQHTD